MHGQYLYLLGGRNGNVPLKDFWRYNIGERETFTVGFAFFNPVTFSQPDFTADNVWEQLRASGDPPGCLQEHTMVGYRDELYVFGGEVGFSNGVETPLWIYSIKV